MWRTLISCSFFHFTDLYIQTHTYLVAIFRSFYLYFKFELAVFERVCAKGQKEQKFAKTSFIAGRVFAHPIRHQRSREFARKKREFARHDLLHAVNVVNTSSSIRKNGWWPPPPPPHPTRRPSYKPLNFFVCWDIVMKLGRIIDWTKAHGIAGPEFWISMT